MITFVVNKFLYYNNTPYSLNIVPGAVRAFTVEPDSDSYTKAVVKWKIPDLREQNGRLRKFEITYEHVSE